MTDTNNFDTCQHRSEEPEISITVKSCCGGSQEVKKSFLCWVLTLEGVTAEICEQCIHYKKRKIGDL